MSSGAGTNLDAAVVKQRLHLSIENLNCLALAALRVEDNEHWLAGRVTFQERTRETTKSQHQCQATVSSTCPHFTLSHTSSKVRKE